VQLFGSAGAIADVGVHTMGSVFTASAESILRESMDLTARRQLKTDDELGDGGVSFHGKQPGPRTHFKTDDHTPFGTRQSTAVRAANITSRLEIYKANFMNYTEFRIPALLVIPKVRAKTAGDVVLAFAEARGPNGDVSRRR
jgi:hypothetical protein